MPAPQRGLPLARSLLARRRSPWPDWSAGLLRRQFRVLLSFERGLFVESGVRQSETHKATKQLPPRVAQRSICGEKPPKLTKPPAGWTRVPRPRPHAQTGGPARGRRRASAAQEAGVALLAGLMSGLRRRTCLRGVITPSKRAEPGRPARGFGHRRSQSWLPAHLPERGSRPPNRAEGGRPMRGFGALRGFAPPRGRPRGQSGHARMSQETRKTARCS